MATTDVNSPVTGSVWKLECKEGQQVAEDDMMAGMHLMYRPGRPIVAVDEKIEGESG